MLAAKLAGDPARVVDAAVEFWLAPHDATIADDELAAEVWAAIAEAGAVPAAIHALGTLVAKGQRIRPASFVDVVEHDDDRDRVLALAESFLAGPDPYLGAVFARLVALGHERALWQWIGAHRDRLRAAPETWLLVAFTLATSRMGDRHDVDDWFADWHDRRDVPMWIVAAYMGSIRQTLGVHADDKLTQLAWRAFERTRPDASIGFVMSFLLVEELRARRDDAFHTGLREHGDALAALHLVDHPLVAYANRVKRRRPVHELDFHYRPPEGGAWSGLGLLGVAVAVAQPRPVVTRPPDWHLVELVLDLEERRHRAAQILPLFAAMLDVDRGDPRAVELFREMSRARLSELPQVQPIWHQLVKQRIRWLTRLRLEYT